MYDSCSKLLGDCVTLAEVQSHCDNVILRLRKDVKVPNLSIQCYCRSNHTPSVLGETWYVSVTQTQQVYNENCHQQTSIEN